jgi:excisionase family DNA binding protein
MTKERIQLMSVEAASEALGLKPPTLRAWMARRRIAFVRIGRRVCIPNDEVDRIIRIGYVPARTESR